MRRGGRRRLDERVYLAGAPDILVGPDTRAARGIDESTNGAAGAYLGRIAFIRIVVGGGVGTLERKVRRGGEKGSNCAVDHGNGLFRLDRLGRVGVRRAVPRVGVSIIVRRARGLGRRLNRCRLFPDDDGRRRLGRVESRCRGNIVVCHTARCRGWRRGRDPSRRCRSGSVRSDFNDVIPRTIRFLRRFHDQMDGDGREGNVLLLESVALSRLDRLLNSIDRCRHRRFGNDGRRQRGSGSVVGVGKRLEWQCCCYQRFDNGR